MLRNAKVLVIALAIFVIAGSAYAFAAANTVVDNSAGSVATTVGGYDVSSVVYDLNVTNPTLVDEITFSITPATGSAAAVTVMLQVDGTNWVTCSVVDGTLPAVDATCAYGALALADVDTFNVVASSSADPAP